MDLILIIAYLAILLELYLMVDAAITLGKFLKYIIKKIYFLF